MNIKGKIRELYAVTQELEAEFPGRRFTPDGHMIGSIGEVIVADAYGLELLPNSAAVHDAKAPDGRLVQIKATQIDRVALNSCPDFLIVICLDDCGEWEEVYNGPGKPVWDKAGRMQKNGQRPIRLTTLKRLMSETDPSTRIPRVD